MTVATGLPRGAPAPPVNKWLVTVSVTFGTLMGAIDASIVNVAIPHIQGTVGADVTAITWVTTGFVMATVIVMPLTAFLGGFFGQKRFYMFSLGLFLAGSALCGTARSLSSLVTYRVVQGLGAGALQPTEQAILRQTFPLEEQGMAMALFGMAVLVGPAVGPTLGGYLTDHYSWPWIFYVNLPVGILGLTMVWRFVREPEDIRSLNRARAERQRRHLDWSGIVLLAVGLGSLQYVLAEGQRDDWFGSRLILGLSLIAAVTLAAFTVRELTAPVPAVNLRLFGDPVFSSGTLIGAMMFALLLANVFLLPLFMQDLLGFSALQSGLALMPRALIMMVATPVVGRLYNHVSPRVTVALGIVLFALGAYAMGRFTLATSSSGIVAAILVQGVGFACLFVPLTTAALSTTRRADMVDATGLNSLLRQVGASVGLAGFATLLERYTAAARMALVAHTSPARPEVFERLRLLGSALVARGYAAGTDESGALRALDLMVTRQASVLAFEKVFWLAGLLFLLVLPLLIFLRAQRVVPGSAGHGEVEAVG